ncbi:MAG: PDZ domain-containing protein [Verrucomicrobia bacterium]|nr:PDZ domain-containing protein [Verrucomicrobiota bacterium]
MSADGKKVLAIRDSGMTVVNTSPNQRWEHPVNTGTMQQRLDPRAEWAQMLRDVWRRQRDFFYVENLHAVDWDAVWEQYSSLLPYVSSRGDLLFVMGEMIAELNVGHAYISGGDFEDEPSLNIGLLGADFSWDEDAKAYRIDRILRGAPWDFDGRGPLAMPGLQVNEGDYLLSINQLELARDLDPWLAAAGLAGQIVTLEVAKDPADPDSVRTLVTRLIGNDSALRFREWIEHNRQYVERASGGRIGYIYVPNTGVDGQNELFRQFYGQIGREALIIDERWNGGGQLPHRFVELLNRPVQMYWARRDGKDWATPSDGHNGPKAMLINGLAGSGGDAFPYLFRRAGLGQLIGTRTWGGLVGITSVPGLIDGGSTAVPTFGVYSTNGHWMIEGHGVDPDIEVLDDPGLMMEGGDPQLDAAIQHLLQELERNPVVHPERPAPPDRSGFGIDPAHR